VLRLSAARRGAVRNDHVSSFVQSSHAISITHKYGRYLATFVLADGTNVNDLAVSTGHAVVYMAGGSR
jgi:endonuclease YncB( thermonuclease family)